MINASITIQSFQPIKEFQGDDTQLWQTYCEYGNNARLWKRKVANLVPEIYKRQLYKKKGFASIYECAAKIGALSKNTVDEVLRLHKRLESKPVLKAEIARSGWSKVRVVSAVATKETQSFWAEKVQKLSKGALENYVQEWKTLPRERFKNFSFKISKENEHKLRKLKQKIEKEKKEAVSFNEVLTELFKQQKEPHKKRSKTKKQKPGSRHIKATRKQIISRYIPTTIKQNIQEKYKGYCAFPNCNKPSEILHHTKRFALSKKHDANEIIPLCKNHESLAHHGLIANEDKPTDHWHLRKHPDHKSLAYVIDNSVQKFRRL